MSLSAGRVKAKKKQPPQLLVTSATRLCLQSETAPLSTALDVAAEGGEDSGLRSPTSRQDIAGADASLSSDDHVLHPPQFPVEQQASARHEEPAWGTTVHSTQASEESRLFTSANLGPEPNQPHTTPPHPQTASPSSGKGPPALSPLPSVLASETGKPAQRKLTDILKKAVSKIILAVDVTSRMHHLAERRMNLLVDQMPRDSNDDIEISVAVRILLACGLTVPAQLAETNVDQLIKRSELVKLLEACEGEILRMDHLDIIDDEDASEERKTVAPARVVIFSRLAAFAKHVKNASGTWLYRGFEIVHFATILVHFVCVCIFNTVYLEKEPLGVHAALWVIWSVWVVDLIWTLTSPVVDHSGNVLVGSAQIAWCKRHVVCLDLFCALPVDMALYHFCTTKSSFIPAAPVYRVFLAMRFMKLVKPLRVLWLFEFGKLDIVSPSFVTFFFFVKPTLRIVALAVIGVQVLVVAMSHTQKSDPYGPPEIDVIDSLVYVMSLLSGAGVNVAFHSLAGTVFEFVMISLGLITQAAVISNLSVTVFRNDVSAMNVEQMRETLNILDHFKVPKDVSTEILSFQLHTLSDDVSKKLSTLDTLPSTMQREVLLYVKVAAVNTVKLFVKSSHDCKMKIAESLVQTVVPPSTNIVAIGDVGDEMFLIAHGYATVIIFNGATVAMLSRGDYFGEVALLLPNNVRQATVRALTYCDLWVLNKKAFLQVIEEFPALISAMDEDLTSKGIDVGTLNLLKKKEKEIVETHKSHLSFRRPTLRETEPHTNGQGEHPSLGFAELRRVSTSAQGGGEIVGSDDTVESPMFEPALNVTAFTTTRGADAGLLEASIRAMNNLPAPRSARRTSTVLQRRYTQSSSAPPHNQSFTHAAMWLTPENALFGDCVASPSASEVEVSNDTAGASPAGMQEALQQRVALLEKELLQLTREVQELVHVL